MDNEWTNEIPSDVEFEIRVMSKYNSRQFFRVVLNIVCWEDHPSQLTFCNSGWRTISPCDNGRAKCSNVPAFIVNKKREERDLAGSPVVVKVVLF